MASKQKSSNAGNSVEQRSWKMLPLSGKNDSSPSKEKKKCMLKLLRFKVRMIVL
jgi:hypothetical protein